MSKTAMQELRENIKESSILSKAAKLIVIAFIDNQIETEKQQIIKAVNDTFENAQSLMGGRKNTPIDGNDYYNHFYTTKPLNK